ncbi:hypothetical protein [Paenibacillus sedimenti]|uniref:Uncharacterized protein n=1 Tax=Paenibacillus sedimenti TaxID=2770274 RepID=A0A926KS94_9BACL|nr:hypothetical protein [Paenibacillus sedimenti]MBD0382597.1 hypothetical protein [Paenibacillus sedimenti]
MGVNFSAAFKHSFDFKSIQQFKEELIKEVRFPKIVQCILEVNEHNPHLRREWSLNRQRIIESINFGPFDPIVIGGPGGFDFIFNKYMCEFNPCFRWYSFLKSPELQLEIRSICKEIADYFCCDFAIYTGDSYGALDYVFEGHNMEYYKADLIRRFGDAKGTLQELLERSDKDRKSDGYYIDNFNDLTN